MMAHDQDSQSLGGSQLKELEHQKVNGVQLPTILPSLTQGPPLGKQVFSEKTGDVVIS